MTAGSVVVADGAALALRAADWVAGRLAEGIAARGTASIALAGGTTPRATYQLLAGDAGARVSWPAVEIFFGDERAVPPDHPESNYRMAREALLDRVAVDPGRVHRMAAESRDLDRAAADYAASLPAILDVVLLGIGSDGHVASLFPGNGAVTEQERRVVRVNSPKPPPVRLTITPPVIAAAAQVAVLATGAEKAAAVARALEGPDDPAQTPACLARGGTWFLDSAAAARLGSR